MDNPSDPTRDRKRSQFHKRRVALRVAQRTADPTRPRKNNQLIVSERRSRVLALLAIVFGLELALAALTSPFFSVHRITLHGVSALQDFEIEALRQTVVLPKDSNLFRAPFGTFESRLHSYPWIQDAKCRWNSNHAIDVLCRVRQPSVIAQVNGLYYEIDEKSIPIRIARQETLKELPLIEVEPRVSLRLGSVIDVAGVQSAIDVYRDARSQPLLRIGKIQIDQLGNMCLNMRDNLRVSLGDSTNLRWKMSYVRRLYETNPNVARDLPVIDISCPAQPVCAPRQPAAAAPSHPGNSKPDGSGRESSPPSL